MVAGIGKAHSNMVRQQVRPGDVLDTCVLSALADVPRELFVADGLAGVAYADAPLPIGCGQVMLTPLQAGRMLQALQLTGRESVLEIGSGTGYFTALLAGLARSVISVELIASLSQRAAENLRQLGIDNVTLEIGNAAKGWPLPDRVDAIVMTAAFARLPDDYLHALEVGGRLLAVTGKAPLMSVQLIHRDSEWDWRTETVFETLIPPMTHAEPRPEFDF